MATRMVQGAVISPSRAGLAYAVHTSAGRHSASLVGGVLDLHTRPAARRGERVDTAMSARRMLAAQHISDLPGYVSSSLSSGRRWMTSARPGEPDGEGGRHGPGIISQLSLGILGALRGLMRDAASPLTKAKEEQKPYIPWEELVAKAEGCLRFARRAHLENLKGRELDDAHFEMFGFNLGVRQSMIRRAGRGVFLTRGAFQAGTVLSFYPGTTYTISQIIDSAIGEFHNANSTMASVPGMPAFMYRNRYLLQENRVVERGGAVKRQELIIDGNPYGQSALRFLDGLEKSEQRCEQGWLELEKSFHTPWRATAGAAVPGARTPWHLGVKLKANRGLTGARSKLSMGHLFNHLPEGQERDVNFYFVQLPELFDPDLLWHVPSINASLQYGRAKTGEAARRWVILAVASRARAFGDVPQKYASVEGDAEEQGKVRTKAPLSLSGEVEIYVDYGDKTKSMGWQAFKAKSYNDRFLHPIVAASLSDAI